MECTTGRGAGALYALSGGEHLAYIAGAPGFVNAGSTDLVSEGVRREPRVPQTPAAGKRRAADGRRPAGTGRTPDHHGTRPAQGEHAIDGREIVAGSHPERCPDLR